MGRWGNHRRLFDGFLDVDHDGAMTLNEFARYVSKFEHDIGEDDGEDGDALVARVAARRDVQGVISEFDFDGDGCVSWDEFATRLAYLDDAARYTSAVRSEVVAL